MAWTSLCELHELTDGLARYVEIDGFELAVFLHEGNVTVLDNMCPHAGGNLAGGSIEDGCAVCPLHHWAFRLENGEMRDMPGVGVRKYPTRLLDFDGKRLVQAELPSY